jgi:hypothetical protein
MTKAELRRRALAAIAYQKRKQKKTVKKTIKISGGIR